MLNSNSAVRSVATSVLALVAFGAGAARGQEVVGPGTLPVYQSLVPGAPGNAGHDGTDEHGGGNATAGTNPGDQTYDFKAATITGPAASGAAVRIVRTGGAGGRGGDAGEQELLLFLNGGDAGNGAAGGSIQSLTMDSGTSVANSAGSGVAIDLSGGNGGRSGAIANRGTAGTPGSGGFGGGLVAQIGATIDVAGTAFSVRSTGGDGGLSLTSAHTLTGGSGPNGGRAGNGGGLDLGFTGALTSIGSAVYAYSAGGNGGDGGQVSTGGVAHGTSGGDGGAGGQILIDLDGATVTSAAAGGSANVGGVKIANGGAAIQGLSVGGVGGAGGNGEGDLGGHGGGGGSASGTEGKVSLALENSTVRTSGAAMAGMLAQSIGGHGGNGAYGGGLFVSSGGNGRPGGVGGTVDLTTAGGSLVTTGASSVGIAGQSIGGGGGFGGDASVAGILVTVAVGGAGASGGNGGVVNLEIGGSILNGLTTSSTIYTIGSGATALLGQSIGGGGGVGGDASALTAGGFASIAVGGNGGNGGVGGRVTAANFSVVQTDGDHAIGLELQSIGGGGGKGGAAYATTIGGQFVASTAVGGCAASKGDSDCNGGSAGAAIASNSAQIVTSGTSSAAVSLQSIGGGGGNGGSSVARGFNLVNTPEAPSANINVAIGGRGGNAGAGGLAEFINEGLVMTLGAWSPGIRLLSLGGGGGSGGDANAFGFSTVPSSFTGTAAIGGLCTGGHCAGGTGGEVLLSNSGTVMTFGEDSHGVVAQSIGGGGGNGGIGGASYENLFPDDEVPTVAMTLSVGGSGGNGGVGGLVTVNNTHGGILTAGNGARGVFAQSVGGGGGSGGGAVATGSGSTGAQYEFKVAVGGAGGSGGNGNAVTVTTGGTILTQGGHAAAIYAQSIGGGGGTGGVGAVNGGRPGFIFAADFLANDLPDGERATKIIDGVYDIVDKASDDWESLTKLRSYASAHEAAVPHTEGTEAATSPKSKLSVDIGGSADGKGGAGGDGGTVTVTNSGTIETDGSLSDAIFAQSIGGAGGDGGASIATARTSGLGAEPEPEESKLEGEIHVGGGGGSSGSAGAVTVGNSGAITTLGDISYGILAQSIGGGGGRGSVSTGEAGFLPLLKVKVGGSGGSHGHGGAVTITSSGSISTAGNASAAILAQSIGGGGGLAAVFALSDNAIGEKESHFDIFGFADTVLDARIPVAIAGSQGSSGNGAKVSVTASGNISTTGTDGYVVLAQSIGGGGGAIVANTTTYSADAGKALFQGTDRHGLGGAVDVTLSGVSVTTSGKGAVGVLAQSIGGGGGLVGAMANVDVTNVQNFATQMPDSFAGNVTVNIAGSGLSDRLTTTGARAHGVVAQAISGGGGILASADGKGMLVAGSPGGHCNCTVSVTNSDWITVSGAGSYGIFAQNRGGNGAIEITNHNILAAEGAATAAIRTDGDGTVHIVNDGYLSGPVAIEGSTATIDNYLWLTGDILATGTGHTIVNHDGGATFNFAGRIFVRNRIEATSLSNQGTIWLGRNGPTTAVLTGNLTSPGDIVVENVDLAAGTAARLVVQGTAAVTGRVLFNPSSIANKAVTILEAGSLSIGDRTHIAATGYNYDGNTDGYTAVAPYLFSYQARQQGNALILLAGMIDPTTVPTLTVNELATAQNLQQAYYSGATAVDGKDFLALSNAVTDAASYARVLDGLNGQTLGAIAANVPSITRAFVSEMLGCNDLTSPDYLQEDSCAWARVSRTWVNNDGGSASRSNLTRYQAGFQKDVGAGWFAGLSASYDVQKITAAALRDDFRGHGVAAGGFVKHQAHGWLFAGSVSGGWNWYRGSRGPAVGAEAARSKPRVQNFSALVRAEYDYRSGNFYARPHLDLASNYVHLDAIDEAGSSLPLRIDATRNWSLAASPSVELGFLGHVGQMRVRPFVGAGGIFEHGNDVATRARFAGDGPSGASFRTNIVVPNALGRLSAGLEIAGWHSLQFDVRYEAELAHDYTAQTVRGRLTWNF